MIKRLSVLLFATIFLISSCGILRDKNLAKRYKNHANSNTFALSTDPQSFVQVDLHTTLLSEPPAKEINYNLLSLSDKGQEAFIQSAEAKTTSSAQLMDFLNTNFAFAKEEKPKFKIITKTIKKTLIFTIDRLQYQFVPGVGAVADKTIFNNLGDRVSYLELNVALPAATKAVFNSWDKFVSDRITLNLGKVSAAQNWNASLNLAAKGSGETSLTGSNTTEGSNSNTNTGTVTLVNTDATNSNTNGTGYELQSANSGSNNKTNSLKAAAELGGSATVGFSDKYETSLDLTSQILKLSGTLAEDKILLRQEGGPGIDLSGNVVVSIEYALTDDWATPVLFTKFKELYTAGIPKAAANIKPSYLTVLFPDIKSDIKGELNYSFLYRQVNHGNRHIPEARQKVKYRYGRVLCNENTVINKAPVTLIKKEDIRPKAYQIQLGANKLVVNGTELKFETVSEAATFLAYIKDLIDNNISLAGITLGGNVLTSTAFPNLQIITTQL